MEDDDAILANTALQKMLAFETQIFLDILHKDGLVVAAKGLSTNVVLLNLMRVYCDPGNLVIVLNCSEHEEKYFVEKLQDVNVHTTSYTTGTTEREDVYLSGGIHFVTTRVLVVDMLKKRVPIEKITGFFVLRAHAVLESCQEAFVLRLYRQHNKTGFVKAFSNSAESFTVGFGHVERVMRTIFVKELYLWPRFHAIVCQTLNDMEGQVIELHFPVSDTVSKVQASILELMNLTIKELKRINKTIELEEVSVENCMAKNFQKILQSQLDCIWNQLSQKSKQLVSDLRTLRHLLLLLFYSDTVTFYSTLLKYRTMEYAKTSFWVLLEAAEQVFALSANLVYSKDRELNPEFCPKWNPFFEILKVEIPHEIKTSKYETNKVLVLCNDWKTCFQLNQLLVQGPHHYLFLMALQHDLKFNSINKNFEKCQSLRTSFVEQRSIREENSKAKGRKKTKLESEAEEKVADEDNAGPKELEDLENMRSSYVVMMSQSVLNNGSTKNDKTDDIVFEAFEEMDNLDLTQLLDTTRNSSQPTILIQTFKDRNNSMSLQSTLADFQPNYIIMYHMDMSATREIEMYEARRPKGRPLKVYFLLQSETVEEQTYLTTLRMEKQAFNHLIEKKSTMVVPEDQDGKSEHCLALQREARAAETNTRCGGEPDGEKVRQVVIVDMREFRSELPALIHKRGIDIEPLTITVGDYIITKDICVERKSLSDLVGSLRSGRLYQQCTQMSRYYARPMLLIEFDQNKPFTWQSNYVLSTDENSFDIQQRLLLLTLHFPKLKIIWSQSPYASAQLFEELKDGKDQPDVKYATAVGNETDADVIEAKYNTGIYDFVQKLPGITSKNIDAFMRRFDRLDDVLDKSEEELKVVLGNKDDTKSFYSALHHEQAAGTQEESKGRGKKLAKFKHCQPKKSK